MTIGITLANDLADIVTTPFVPGGNNEARGDLTRQLRTADLEPYRGVIHDFVIEHGPDIARRHDVIVETNNLISMPGGRTGSMPELFAWMREHRSGPFADTTTAPTGATPMTHAEDVFTQLLAIPMDERTNRRRDLVRTLSSGDMVPYGEQLRAFTRTPDGMEWTWDTLLDNPGNKSRGIPMFARYLQAQGLLPVAAAVPQGDTIVDERHTPQWWAGQALYDAETFRSIDVDWLRTLAPAFVAYRAETGAGDYFEQLIAAPGGNTSVIRPFMQWLAGHPEHMPATTPAVTAPARPTVEEFLGYTAGQLREYTDDLAAFLPQSRMPLWGSSEQAARDNANAIVRSPADYRGTNAHGVLRQLIEAVHAGTYTLIREQTPVTTEPTGRPSLPTSPQQAFPTLAAMLTAYDEWASSTDERLPEVMEAPSGGRPVSGHPTYTRTEIRNGSGWRGMYHNEIRAAWDADSFDHDRSFYANGFWRDVRELGYGTPYFDYLGKPTPATPGAQLMPIGPDHPGWEAWWTRLRSYAQRDGYLRQFGILADAMGYTQPRQYDVSIRITSPQALTRDTVLEYLRQHPEALGTGRARDLYTV